MMTYKEFREMITEELEKRIGDLGEIITGLTEKNNNCIMEYMTLKRKDVSKSTLIYIDKAYNAYRNGESMDTILDRMEKELTHNITDSDIELIKDWSKAESCVYPKLINTGLNTEFLERVPHREILDLSVVYYIEHTEEGKDIKASSIVNNDILTEWGITPKMLHEKSIENFERNKPAFLSRMSLSGMYMERCLTDISEKCIGENEIYMLTGGDGYMGAAYFIFPDILKRISDVLCEDIVILPSSVHELVIFKKDGYLPPENMAEMVRDVNRTVRPDEILSESVYEYSDGELKIIA